MNKPVFSIIVPCYNHAHYLKDCIDSVISQTISSWELILINDGSADNTESIAINYQNQDSRILYIFQSNQGLSAARNSGMSKSQGEFLIFLDADDWLEKDCLYIYYSIIETKPDCEFFRCGYAYWDQPKGRKYHTHTPSGNGAIYPDSLTHNIGPCHSILIRRVLAKKLGGFDTSLKSCEDWDFWIRAGKVGAKIYSIPEVLVAYRYVADSMSRNPRVMYEALTEVSRRAGESDDRLPDSAPFNRPSPLDYPAIQRKHLIALLGVMLYQGRVEEAAKWYLLEQAKWNWEVRDADWKGLASYLSWGYFFEKDEIRKLMQDTFQLVEQFFREVGYSNRLSERLARLVFLPQVKKQNHLRYGWFLGAILNRLGGYRQC